MTFAREGLLCNRTELEPLFEEHWKDVTPDFNNVELGFDWEAYEAMEKAGQVHMMVAREGGDIVGYHLCLANRHAHSKESQIATTAFFYMKPEQRFGWLVVRLFRETEKSLKALGIDNLYIGCKVDRNLAPIFVRLGYHPVEHIFAKELA